MKLHDVKQGSIEWLLLRSGIPTASEFKALITPTGKVSTGEGVQTYLHKKIGEWWMGTPLTTFRGPDMEQGNVLEDEAIPWYELEFGKVQRVGFVTTDDGKVGCSPDGLLPGGLGIEIKCPEVHTHVGYLLGGDLPKEYLPQVHGSMFVTGAPAWYFLSYRRGFPKFLLRVERDEKIQAAIEEAIDHFLEIFEDAKNVMIDLNGGPPKRGLTPMPREDRPKSAFVSEEPS